MWVVCSLFCVKKQEKADVSLKQINAKFVPRIATAMIRALAEEGGMEANFEETSF